jgi:hypothetical protein
MDRHPPGGSGGGGGDDDDDVGNHEVKELQKIAILGTAHILQKVLM